MLAGSVELLGFITFICGTCSRERDGEEKQIRRLKRSWPVYLRINWWPATMFISSIAQDHLIHRHPDSDWYFIALWILLLPLAAEECWLKSAAEMETLFSDPPKRLRNSDCYCRSM